MVRALEETLESLVRIQQFILFIIFFFFEDKDNPTKLLFNYEIQRRNTMNEDGYKEVRFDVYCPRCIHEKESPDVDVCNDCLSEPVNLHSHKPVKFVEKEKK